MRIPKRFEVSVVGLFLLDREIANRIGGDLKRNFDRFRIFDSSGDLMTADGPAIESPVSGSDLALRMPHLDETSRGGCAFDHAHADTHDVVSRRKLLGCDDDAARSVGELQIGSAITVWQARVVFVIGQVVPIRIGIAGSGFLRVPKTELFRIGCSLEAVGISVEASGVVDEAIRLSNLRDPRLIFRSLRGFIHSFFPTGKTGIFVFNVRDLLFVCRIDRRFRFDSDDHGFHRL